MSCDVAKGRSIRFIADRVQVDEERSDKAVSFEAFPFAYRSGITK